MKIIIGLIIFSVIVIVHELGHFIFAKLFDVKVNEFWLGMGPSIFHIKGKETVFHLRILPLGGACVMEGEDQGESDDPRAIGNKPAWQRFFIVFAGPFFNFILAFIIAFAFIAMCGVDKPIITGVVEGSGAESAGLCAGDEIIKLGNYNVHFFSEISIYNYFHEGKVTDVTYRRGDAVNTVSITPVMSSKEDNRYLLGIYGSYARAKVSPLEVLAYSFYEVKYEMYTTLRSLAFMITGKVPASEISGAVGIVDIIGDVYESSKTDGMYYVLVNMLSLTVLLSANLGVMNLLPIPALDGGRLIFILFEMIFKKRCNQTIEGYVHIGGFFVLMALMIVMVINDVMKIVG